MKKPSSCVRLCFDRRSVASAKVTSEKRWRALCRDLIQVAISLFGDRETSRLNDRDFPSPPEGDVGGGGTILLPLGVVTGEQEELPLPSEPGEGEEELPSS